MVLYLYQLGRNKGPVENVQIHSCYVSSERSEARLKYTASMDLSTFLQDLSYFPTGASIKPKRLWIFKRDFIVVCDCMHFKTKVFIAHTLMNWNIENYTKQAGAYSVSSSPLFQSYIHLLWFSLFLYGYQVRNCPSFSSPLPPPALCLCQMGLAMQNGSRSDTQKVSECIFCLIKGTLVPPPTHYNI